MTETIIIYILILFAMLGFTAVTPNCMYGHLSRIPKWRYWLWLSAPILLYTVFWGLRDGVGADYEAYKEIFLHTLSYPRIETGYIWLNELLSEFGFGYVSIFVVTSAVTIISLYATARQQSKIYAVAIIYIFFTSSMVFSAQNGLRQHMAISLVLMALVLLPLNKRKILSLCLIIGSSVLLHKSVSVVWVIIILLYVFPRIKINKYWIIGTILVFNVLSAFFLDVLYSYLGDIFALLSYSSYYERFSDFVMNTEVSSGLGVALRIVLYCVVIYYQDDILNDKHMSEFTYIVYVMFVVGAIMEPVVAENMILKRMNLYFQFMKVPVFALAISILSRRKDALSPIVLILLLIASMMFYITAILSNSNNVVPYNMI